MRRAMALLLTLGLLGVGRGYAAEEPPRAWSFKNNFSIPDAPAYLLLEVEPSDILRPETPRDLALGFAKFQTESGGIGIPRANPRKAGKPDLGIGSVK